MHETEYWQRCLRKDLGPAIAQEPVPQEVIEAYRGILPETLLHGWATDGWCGYGQGRYWTVNPREYDHLLGIWLAGTPLMDIDRYHVFARTVGRPHECVIIAQIVL